MTKDDMAAELAGLAFGQPWAARLFGVTLALSEAGLFTMKDFQAALIESVGAFEKAGCIADEEAYYTRWLEALGALLAAGGVLRAEALSEVEARVARRLLDLQHERHRHDHDVPPVIAPLVVA